MAEEMTSEELELYGEAPASEKDATAQVDGALKMDEDINVTTAEGKVTDSATVRALEGVPGPHTEADGGKESASTLQGGKDGQGQAAMGPSLDRTTGMTTTDGELLVSGGGGVEENVSSGKRVEEVKTVKEGVALLETANIAGAEEGTAAKASTGDDQPEENATDKNVAAPEGADSTKANGTTVVNGSESKNGAESKNGGPKDESSKDGVTKNASEEDSGESEESGDEEDEEDDDEQDDFDVILNVDDVDPAVKPGGGPLAGSIGKVRLPSNKWHRPGYVPPERVTNPTQTGARAGGVLAMLPTPTQPIRTTQKSVYDLEIGKLTEKPWLERGADLSDYFNYGFNEDTWKLYCERQMQMRLEASSLAKIKTVDGNRNQNAGTNRANTQGNQKNMQPQQNLVARNQPNGAMPVRNNIQNKMPPPPPPGGPGMMPPPGGLGVPPGGIPVMPPGMPKLPNNVMPNLPFPFPGVQNGKGGGFQPPFPPFLPMPGNQGKGDGKNPNAFPFMPGMPGMPILPGGMQSGAGRGGSQQVRGYPGQMHTPHKGQQQGAKNMRPQSHRPGMMDNSQGRGIKRPPGGPDQNSRFGPGQGNSNSHGPPVHPSRQGHMPSHPQGQHGDDDRRRWNNNRGSNNDRRQDGGDSRGRGEHDDRYGDRGHNRRRRNDNREDGDRRRGYDQRYGDQRRDYDRDNDHSRYRKRSGSRDYDDDRKRPRR